MANDIVGVDEVKKLLNEVGKLTAKSLTTASKKGARIALAWAKSHLYNNGFEEDTGTLKRSLKIRKEKRKTGKSVYQVGPNASGWYAHFLDYGFFSIKAQKFIPGNRFLRNSADSNRDQINKAILQELHDALSKLR